MTTLQFNENFLVMGGNNGWVRLFETKTGRYVRDLVELVESVCKVRYVGNICVVMCRRVRETVVEVWSCDLAEVKLERAW